MSFVEENFELLYGIGKCIAEQFGPNCEVVLLMKIPLWLYGMDM